MNKKEVQKERKKKKGRKGKWGRGDEDQLPESRSQCQQDTGSLVREHKATSGGSTV